ncbi:MAG: hypothetical protein KUL81_00145 [Azonexus sp.]|nr:hypothetical protein [Azonexus sp.]
MPNTRIPESAGKEYWRINDQIPTVHHWPASDRVPVDISLPRHAFDIRRGVQWRIGRRLDDLLERYILRPLGKFLLRFFDRRSR